MKIITRLILLIFLSYTLSSCVSLEQQKLADAWYNIGNQYYDLAKWDRAGEAYNAALDLNPNLTSASFNLARALAESGNYDKALAVLEKINANKEDNLRAKTLKAYILFKQGKALDAYNLYKEILKDYPYDLNVNYNYALMLDGLDKTDEAITNLENLITVQPDDIDVRILLAKLQIKAGKEADGLAGYEALIPSGKLSTADYENLAKIYEDKKNYGKAIEVLKKATTTDAKSASAWFHLARLQLTVAEDSRNGIDALQAAIDAKFTDKKAATELVIDPNLVARDTVTQLIKDNDLYDEIYTKPASTDTPQDKDKAGTKVTDKDKKTTDTKPTDKTKDTSSDKDAKDKVTTDTKGKVTSDTKEKGIAPNKTATEPDNAKSKSTSPSLVPPPAAPAKAKG